MLRQLREHPSFATVRGQWALREQPSYTGRAGCKCEFTVGAVDNEVVAATFSVTVKRLRIVHVGGKVCELVSLKVSG